jgi:hypothetical protein
MAWLLHGVWRLYNEDRRGSYSSERLFKERIKSPPQIEVQAGGDGSVVEDFHGRAPGRRLHLNGDHTSAKRILGIEGIIEDAAAWPAVSENEGANC